MTHKQFMPEGSGPCAKQTVTATLVAIDGTRYVATNWVREPQSECPRAGMATGEGYELCRSVCRQSAHAEINALRLAEGAAYGAWCYLEGHTYACDDCTNAFLQRGVQRIVIGAPPVEVA